MVVSIEGLARTWQMAAPCGRPTSGMCLQRTRQLGMFRQAIAFFFGRGRASGGPDRRGEPIPVVPRVSKLVIGPAQGRVVGRSRSHLRSRLEPAVSRIGSICRKRTCFRPVIYLARIDVGLTTAKRRWGELQRSPGMKIAQIAPLFESVPPRLYGGTERVVSYLTEELVKQGHRVTLFASADATTSAELVPCTPRALRLDDATRDSIPRLGLMLHKVRERADDFDVLHFHIDYLHFPLFRSRSARILTTLHSRLDVPDHSAFYLRF